MTGWRDGEDAGYRQGRDALLDEIEAARPPATGFQAPAQPLTLAAVEAEVRRAETRRRLARL